MCTSLPLQDAVQSKLIGEGICFFSARLLLPCSLAQVVMSVVWVMSIMFPSDTVNLEQRWILSPSHCIQCHGIRRNICPLGVWLPRSSCWWACHPTRIALARLKASEASPQVQFKVPASTVISILSACGIPVCTLLQGNVCTLSQKADYNTRPLDETTKSCHWQGHQPLKNTPPTSDWERWDSENRCHKHSYLTDTDTSLDSGNFNLGLQT